MRRLSILTCVGVVAAAVFAHSLLAPAQGAEMNLSGYWESGPTGNVRIIQDQEYVWILVQDKDKCPNGGSRDWYMAGFLEGDKLYGTMWRCTSTELLDKCKHQPTYKTKFDAKVTQMLFGFGARIEFTAFYQMEYYQIPDCTKSNEEGRTDLVYTSQNPPPTPTPKPPWKGPLDPLRDAAGRFGKDYVAPDLNRLRERGKGK